MSHRLEAKQDESLNFTGFSNWQPYRDANEALLREVYSRLPARFVQIDVASGTGLVPALADKVCRDLSKTARILAIDPDQYALDQSRADNPDTKHRQTVFIQGFAQDLESLVRREVSHQGVDLITIYNAVHLVPETERLAFIGASYRLLGLDGYYSSNSSFTTISTPDRPIAWARWKLKAVKLVGGTVRRDLPGMEYINPEVYLQSLRDAGLTPVFENTRPIEMDQKGLEAISRDPEFILGTFQGVTFDQGVPDLHKKSQALVDAIPAINPPIQRVWCEVIAQKQAIESKL